MEFKRVSFYSNHWLRYGRSQKYFFFTFSGSLSSEKLFFKIFFSEKLVFQNSSPIFKINDSQHHPKSKNFEHFLNLCLNYSKTTRSFEILKTQSNPACGDKQIVCFFLVFVSPFPDLEKKSGVHIRPTSLANFLLKAKMMMLALFVFFMKTTYQS